MQKNLFVGRKISAESKIWLSGENIEFEEHQLIKIEFSKPDYSLFASLENKPKMWMVSSQWSAKWLVKYFNEIGFRSSDCIICLSEKQRKVCQNLTLNILVSKLQNAASLAKLALEKHTGEEIVYLHGNKSLNNVELEMKPLGNQFKKAKVYRNLPVLKKVAGEFDAYLFFSPSGAVSFSEGGNYIPLSSSIVAIGPTTALTCKEIFGREILVSEIQEELAAVQFAAGLSQNAKKQFDSV